MNKKDMLKMVGMMFVVFVVFSIARRIENTTKVDFATSAQQIVIYDIAQDEGAMMTDDVLASHIKLTIDNPNVFFTRILYTEDPIMWEGDYYAVFTTKKGEVLKGKFSNYAYVFAVEGKKGHYRFNLKDEENWLFY